MVTINGDPVSVGGGGIFQDDLFLEPGANTIQVTVTGQSGRIESREIDVSFDAPDGPLPFSLFYPWDGLEVSQANVLVLGVTRPDAMVAINGDPIEANAAGIFSGNPALKNGANLIEVVATDIDGNVRFEAIAVFYTP